ncbi:DUF4258 domain-containing protein [Geomonas sp. Red69]|uniref:DUF4258 domain-containing protein n=1 Tax=Geomonas diazotrophica TaxID=2843197 RepID=UPI001C1107A6|nr:DUF4258 domain-containing protein [Geomonas diazotrophica]
MLTDIMPTDFERLSFTNHARERMGNRHISSNDINNVIVYGRRVEIRGAVIYVVGTREIKYQRGRGIRIDNCDGIHVVCSHDETVITVYRNHDLRGLKPKARKPWESRACALRRSGYLLAA